MSTGSAPRWEVALVAFAVVTLALWLLRVIRL